MKNLFKRKQKEKQSKELIIANNELLYQHDEKQKRAAELIVANKELLFQNNEKKKRASELVIANDELLFQNNEKEKRAAELAVANIELSFQNKEKEKRAEELVIANDELWYQNNEKEKRAAELVIANKELSYQNKEKEKCVLELAFVNEELIFQNDVRKIAEKNLHRSESRLKEAQAISHTGSFDIDMVKQVDEWSDGMFKIYGIQNGSATPSTGLFLSFIHPDDLGYVTACVTEAYKQCVSFTIDFRFIHANGDIKYGYLKAKFKLDKDKKPIRLFGILQDVTNVKLGEIERTKMVNDLILRNNDLEQFAYIISHNLRAPIANIIGASNVLNNIDLTEADKDTLNKAINTSVIRLDDVVQDLNHILQVRGDVNDNKEIVHFTTLVEDIKLSIKNLIDKYGIEIKYNFLQSNELVALRAYLYSIFYNLISNSIKYRQQDIQSCINIKSLKTKNLLQLVFTDNGLGIDLDKNGDDLFGLYKRFHHTTEGKGMGLYMVKTQVETLGGKISVESKLNEGTAFTITFDLA